MAEGEAAVDPAFVASLRGNISGIFYQPVAHWPPEKIAAEFRKIVRVPALVADEEVMENLLFLARKKDIGDLRDDVRRLLDEPALKPRAVVSTWKTAFALGDEHDRAVVDERLSQALARLTGQADARHSPFLEAADGIGGVRALGVLRPWHGEVATRQREVERERPNDHAEIERLDRLRDTLDGKAALIERKQVIRGLPAGDQIRELLKLYLAKTPGLAPWAARELGRAAPATVALVARDVLWREVQQMAPRGGAPEARAARVLDLRLRGIGLLEQLGIPLNEDETRLVRANAEMVASREAFFRPRYDWEDVLDPR